MKRSKRNRIRKRRKEEKKTRKGPRATFQPSSRRGPRPNKPTQTGTLSSLSLPLTCGPQLLGHLSMFNLKQEITPETPTHPIFSPSSIRLKPCPIRHPSAPIKVAPISSLSCTLFPSLSAARLREIMRAVPQTPPQFIDDPGKPRPFPTLPSTLAPSPLPRAPHGHSSIFSCAPERRARPRPDPAALDLNPGEQSPDNWSASRSLALPTDSPRALEPHGNLLELHLPLYRQEQPMPKTSLPRLLTPVVPPQRSRTLSMM
jgi:hypothetical protein